MDEANDFYVKNHRRQLGLLGVGILLLFLLSLLPSSERALFFEGRQVPKVFAVIPKSVADSGVPLFDMNPARRSAFLARLARPGGLAGVIPPSPVPAANVASPTVPESLVPLGAGPLNDPTAPGDVARNFRDNPLAGATPQQFSPAVTPDPTATPSPDPVGAVPEPATWLSMMLGFFVLGTLLRRQRARSIELQAIARQSDGPHLG